jgi:hypothetical protein
VLVVVVVVVVVVLGNSNKRWAADADWVDVDREWRRRVPLEVRLLFPAGVPVFSKAAARNLTTRSSVAGTRRYGAPVDVSLVVLVLVLVLVVGIQKRVRDESWTAICSWSTSRRSA